jgi:hypothetical protein
VRELRLLERTGTSHGLRLRANALLNALSSETSQIQIEYTGTLSEAGFAQVRMEGTSPFVQGENIWTEPTTNSNEFTQIVTLTREQLQRAVTTGTGDITLGATPGTARLVITNIRIYEVTAGEFAPVSVSTWHELRHTINAVGYGESLTINITDSFAFPATNGGEILISQGRNITLTSDSTQERTLTQNNIFQRHFVVENGKLTLGYGITLGGGNHVAPAALSIQPRHFRTGFGGVVVRNNGRFVMNDGSAIRGSMHHNGAAVNIQDGGIFEMNEGSIIAHNRASTGGVVELSNHAIFNMNGGTIANNDSSDGAIVLVSANSRMNMSGGAITDNTAIYGGGVWVGGAIADGFGFYMSGGIITNNMAFNNAGGIYSYMKNPANIHLSNPDAVTGNTPNNTNLFYVVNVIYNMHTDLNWHNITSATLHGISRGINTANVTRIDAPVRQLQRPTRTGTSQGLRLRASALLGAVCSETNLIQIEYTGTLSVAGFAQIRMEGTSPFAQGENVWTEPTTTNNGFTQTVTLTHAQLQHAVTTGTGDITLGAIPGTAGLVITNIRITEVQ